MGKPGPKPKKLYSEKWSRDLAYAVGLLATDGCLSLPAHGYLIDLTSKDKEQIENFCRCIGFPLSRIGTKSGSNGRRYFRVQFKNLIFYKFLASIGLTPAKSHTLGKLSIPDEYFFDFLRGVFDGDGSFYSYWDPRWRSSFMFYTMFASASPVFVEWLRSEVERKLGIRGHISRDGRARTQQLKYAKADSLKLLRRMYRSRTRAHLSRKRLKIEAALGTVGLSLIPNRGDNAQVEKLVNSPA